MTICTLYYIVKIIIVNILEKEKEYFYVLHYFYTSQEFALNRKSENKGALPRPLIFGIFFANCV